MIDDGGREAFGGMRIDEGNRNTRRNPALVPLCSPQIPHDLTWDLTRAAAVGNRRLHRLTCISRNEGSVNTFRDDAYTFHCTPPSK
jgi:hypothetical protein